MGRTSYTQFVQQQIASHAIGDPILVSRIGSAAAKKFGIEGKKANAAVSVALRRIIQTEAVPNLRCFAKGIYYLCTGTMFGDTGINVEKLIAIKYLDDGNGYETGAGMLHKIGLTTWMPAKRVFASNRANGRTKKDEALGIVIRPPRTVVTKENRRYLQFLDLLNDFENSPVDADKPYCILGNVLRMEKLEYGKLMCMADLFYNRGTVVRLAHVASAEGAGI